MKKHRILDSVLETIGKLDLRYPWVLLILSVCLLAGSIYYTATHLAFKTDRNDLVQQTLPYQVSWNRFKEEFDSTDDILVVIEGGDPEAREELAERLGRELENRPDLFADVFYKFDLDSFAPKSLLFYPLEDLETMRDGLRDNLESLENTASARSVAYFYREANDGFNEAISPEGDSAPESVEGLDFLTDLTRSLAVSLRTGDIEGDASPPNPMEEADPAGQAQYNATKDKKFTLIMLKASASAAGFTPDEMVVRELKEMVYDIQKEYPGLNVGLTGKPVLNNDEMLASRRDSIKASILAVIGVGLLFIIAFGEVRRPLIGVVALLFGLGWSLGWTTLIVGHLNILTVSFAVMLIGLGVDFGIHLIARYEEERAKGEDVNGAILKSLRETGKSITTAAFTTASAFFVMVLTDFQGIKELGIIAGSGVLLTLLATLVLVPVLIRLLRIEAAPVNKSRWLRLPRLSRSSLSPLGGPVVLGVGALLGLASLVGLGGVYFDFNLLALQSESLDSVQYEEKLIESQGNSSLFGIVLAENPAHALEKAEELNRLPTVKSVETIADWLPDNQEEKRTFISEIADLARRIHSDAPPAEVDPAQMGALVKNLEEYLRFVLFHSRGKTDEAIRQDLKDLLQAVLNLRETLEEIDTETARERLAAHQRVFLERFDDSLLSLAQQSGENPVVLEDLPEPLRHRYVGATQRILLRVYPEEDIWEREPLERFVADVRSLDPDLTGSPVLLYENSGLFQQSFKAAGLYALIAVAILVGIHFRNVMWTVLSLVPLLVGGLWTLGAMRLLGLSFNPANIMTVPLLVGIGIDNGLHILHRYREEKGGPVVRTSTGRAVLLSTLTTMIGFSSLILARHRGISSLGILMTVGMASILVASLVFLPCLLRVLGPILRKEMHSRS